MADSKDLAEARRRQTSAGIVMLGLLALDLPPVSWTIDNAEDKPRLEGLAMRFPRSLEDEHAVVKAWAAHFDVSPKWEVATKGGYLKVVTAIGDVHVEVWAHLAERPDGVEDGEL